jgi:hypothetical protein
MGYEAGERHESGSGSYPVVGFRIGDAESSGSVTGVGITNTDYYRGKCFNCNNA